MYVCVCVCVCVCVRKSFANPWREQITKQRFETHNREWLKVISSAAAAAASEYSETDHDESVCFMCYCWVLFVLECVCVCLLLLLLLLLRYCVAMFLLTNWTHNIHTLESRHQVLRCHRLQTKQQQPLRDRRRSIRRSLL